MNVTVSVRLISQPAMLRSLQGVKRLTSPPIKGVQPLTNKAHRISLLFLIS